MKYIKFFFLFTLFFYQNYLFSSDDLFKKGNDLFLSGDFKLAKSSYLNISNKSSNVYSNLGDSFFNDKDDFNAIKYWTKAHRGATALQLGRLIRKSIKLFKKRDCPVDYDIKLWSNYLFSIIPISFLNLILIFLYLMIIYLFYHRFKRFLIGKSLNLFNYTSRFLLLIFLISITYLLIHKHNLVINGKKGIVSSKFMTIYAGPEKSFHKKRSIPRCSVVSLSDEKNGMVRIHANDFSGWALRSDLEII